jgi:hypothetical protein
MKFTRLVLSLVALVVLTVSCDQDIDINDNWEDVGVVYGLLNPNATVNWVRIERGYLGTEPASASFNQPDSLYYDTLQVFLYGIDDDGDTLDTRELIKDQSINLDSGLFTTEDYRLYRTEETIPPSLGRLDQDLTYHLRVVKVGTNFKDTKASTELVEPRISSTSGFRFSRPNPNVTPNQRPEYTGQIAWYDSDRAEMYEIDVYFFYRELDTTTGVTISKSFKIDFETQIGPFSPTTRPRESNKNQHNLYEAIAANVPVNEDMLRFYDKMRIEIWAGGEMLRRYTQLNEPSTSLSQTRPEFMQVDNGIGMLSSRTIIRLDDIDLGRGTNGIKNTWYLDPVLCDRNFVNLSSSDTCVCEFFAGDPVKFCF